jgi:hypothetical protein
MDRLGLLELRRLRLLVAGPALALSLAAGGAFALAGPVAAVSPETCPAGTTNIAQFQWTGSAWAPQGAASGVSVSGDATLARWVRDGGTIAAVVITAGTVTINYTYDPRTWNGAIAASDVEAAAGAPLSEIDFCSGTQVSPTSGSKISVGVSKTATCATIGADGMATVSGTITVVRHKPAEPEPSVAIRIRTTRDNVWANGAWLGETTTIPGLTSAVMAPGTDTMTVPYTVSFDPGDATAFTNKIEITVEEAVSGLDRHKYYSGTADFGVCAAVTTPTPEGSVQAATPTPTPTGSGSSPEGSVKAATPLPAASVPNTAAGSPPGDSGGAPLLAFAIMLVSSGGLLAYARIFIRR